MPTMGPATEFSVASVFLHSINTYPSVSLHSQGWSPFQPTPRLMNIHLFSAFRKQAHHTKHDLAFLSFLISNPHRPIHSLLLYS